MTPVIESRKLRIICADNLPHREQDEGNKKKTHLVYFFCLNLLVGQAKCESRWMRVLQRETCKRVQELRWQRC